MRHKEVMGTPRGARRGTDGRMTTAEEHYEAIAAAMRLRPDVRSVYGRLKNVFHNLIDQQTADVRMVFRGPYPKTDYLLKENGAQWSLRRRVHDLRRRLHDLRQTTDETLEEMLTHDVQTLTLFVALTKHAEVPPLLARCFPAPTERKSVRREAVRDVVRATVTRWSDEYIYFQAEDDVSEHDQRVALRTPRGDWSPLLRMLTRGSVINIVGAKQLKDDAAGADTTDEMSDTAVTLEAKEGEEHVSPTTDKRDATVTWRADLLVLEPDYLVDVSAIAGCFTNYGVTALTALMKKVEQRGQTYHTIKGNLASQILDETLQTGRQVDDIAGSMRRFFQQQPLAWTLLTRDELAQLRSEMTLQAEHISRALNDGLPAVMQRSFHPELMIVEPSFYVEMLGLQGRMDLYQSDGRMVMEQKAGKGAWPQGDYTQPVATEAHMVQVMLYSSIVRYAFSTLYRENNGNVLSLLLYSRYRDALYSQGFTATALLHQAMMLRNEMVWWEMRLTEPEGFRTLLTMSVDQMNVNGTTDMLWQRYQRPQLQATLDVLQRATPLEQSYVTRLLTFIANEHMLGKLGNKTKENSGVAAMWYDTLDQKMQAGTIYAALTLVTPLTPEQGMAVEQLHLRFDADFMSDKANFRVGDPVVAYPYDRGGEPDVRKGMVWRATLADISADGVTLRLLAPQSNHHVLLANKARPWAVEHDAYESSTGTMYRGVYSFLYAPRARRDLLLMQRQPEVDTTVTQLRGDYGAFNALALSVKRARDFFLIIGPPGTGKTSYGMLTTLQEELAEEGSTVVMMSYTNRAVDEMCEKLNDHAIDYIRIGNELNCGAACRAHLLSARVQGMDDVGAVRGMIDAARVVVGTTTALSRHKEIFEMKRFSLAIIDEASQILEPHLLPILCATHGGEAAVRKFVMIGDHKQLPAVVQQTARTSAVHDPLLTAIGLTDCRLSLFERLLRRYGDDPAVTYMLTRQGRMHPDIAAFPNTEFYGGRLTAVPLDHQQRSLPTTSSSKEPLERMLATHRVAFIDVAPPADTPSDKVNTAEAEVISRIVECIYQRCRTTFRADSTVGVIVPYRNQVAAVRNQLMRTGIPELSAITVDTVERYQGSQRQYIVYGFTVRHAYQLRFLTSNVFEDTDGTMVDRKLNVAMTRAEEGLVLVGNKKLLCNDPIFSKLIEAIGCEDVAQ